jgi:hypothetical protein
MISRRGWLSGRPDTAGAGGSGSTSAHCSSVRSVGYRRRVVMLLHEHRSPLHQRVGTIGGGGGSPQAILKHVLRGARGGDRTRTEVALQRGLSRGSRVRRVPACGRTCRLSWVFARRRVRMMPHDDARFRPVRDHLVITDGPRGLTEADSRSRASAEVGVDRVEVVAPSSVVVAVRASRPRRMASPRPQTSIIQLNGSRAVIVSSER